MNIKSVNGSLPYIPNVDSKKRDNKDIEKSGDKLEISSEALKIKESSGDLNKLDVVKSRIQSKFYDSNEVLNTVAEKILKEF
jgi:hypothetical protein